MIIISYYRFSQIKFHNNCKAFQPKSDYNVQYFAESLFGTEIEDQLKSIYLNVRKCIDQPNQQLILQEFCDYELREQLNLNLNYSTLNSKNAEMIFNSLTFHFLYDFRIALSKQTNPQIYQIDKAISAIVYDSYLLVDEFTFPKPIVSIQTFAQQNGKYDLVEFRTHPNAGLTVDVYHQLLINLMNNLQDKNYILKMLGPIMKLDYEWHISNIFKIE